MTYLGFGSDYGRVPRKEMATACGALAGEVPLDEPFLLTSFAYEYVNKANGD